MKNIDLGNDMTAAVEADKRKLGARVRGLLEKLYILKKRLPEPSKDCWDTENPAVNAVLRKLGGDDSKI